LGKKKKKTLAVAYSNQSSFTDEWIETNWVSIWTKVIQLGGKAKSVILLKLFSNLFFFSSFYCHYHRSDKHPHFLTSIDNPVQSINHTVKVTF
jgi:hypothetical protein